MTNLHISLKMMYKDFIGFLLPITVITLWSLYDIGILHQQKKVCFLDTDVFVQVARKQIRIPLHDEENSGEVHFSHACREQHSNHGSCL